MPFTREEIEEEFESKRDLTWELAVRHKYLSILARRNESTQVKARTRERLAVRRKTPGYREKRRLYAKALWARSDNAERKEKHRLYQKVWREKRAGSDNAESKEKRKEKHRIYMKVWREKRKSK